MANLKILKNRIRSIKSTTKITRTMSMVAASKMRKAQAASLSSQPYIELFAKSLNHIFSDPSFKISHVLLRKNNSSSVAVLVLSTDRGLAGALNTNLFRFLQNTEDQITKDIPSAKKDIVYYPIGKKARNFLAKTNRRVEMIFEYQDTVEFDKIIEIVLSFTEKFLVGQIGGLYVVFPHFISTLRQAPKVQKLLPVEPEFTVEQKETGKIREFVFEPIREQVIDWVLKHFVQVNTYQAFLEARASEHSARMIAMQSATDNARKLSDELTIMYNRLRQEEVTRDLAERSSAGAAME